MNGPAGKTGCTSESSPGTTSRFTLGSKAQPIDLTSADGATRGNTPDTRSVNETGMSSTGPNQTDEQVEDHSSEAHFQTRQLSESTEDQLDLDQSRAETAVSDRVALNGISSVRLDGKGSNTNSVFDEQEAANAAKRKLEAISRDNPTYSTPKLLLQEPVLLESALPESGYPTEESDYEVPLYHRAARARHYSILSTTQAPDEGVAKERISPISKAESMRKMRVSKFDAAAFDAQFYSQDGARAPPEEVHLEMRSEMGDSPTYSEMLFLHKNPSIHGMHERSKKWTLRKAAEIKSRGGRKAWFGKAAERARWVRSKKKHPNGDRGSETTLEKSPVREDPSPWAYRRPLDFGDVPEEKLPQDVKNDPAWLAACARFRQDRAKKVRMDEVYLHNRREEKAQEGKPREKLQEKSQEDNVKEREKREREKREQKRMAMTETTRQHMRTKAQTTAQQQTQQFFAHINRIAARSVSVGLSDRSDTGESHLTSVGDRRDRARPPFTNNGGY